MILAGDVVPKVAEPLFDAAGIHHVHAAQLQVHVLTRLEQRLEYMACHVGTHVHFPTQLAHIGHTVHAGLAHAYFNLLGGAERVHIIAEIRRADGLQEFAGIGAHHSQHTLACGDVCNNDTLLAHMALHPRLIGQPRGRRGDDQIGNFAQSGDGHIRFDPATFVQELGVHDLAYGHVILATPDIVHKGHGIRPFDTYFAKGRHVVHADIFTHRTVLFFDVVKEILTFPRVFIGCRLIRLGKPVCPFPPRQFAHDGTAFHQIMMKRRAPDPSRRRFLAIGEMICVQQAQRLSGPGREVCLVPLKWLHAGNIHIPQIKRLGPILHPLRQRHASAPCRLDADRIKAAGDPHIVHLGGKPKVIGIVGRKGFRAIKERMNPSLGEHRHAVHGRL